MKIHKSQEDYLEAILVLSKKGPVRAVDVAETLGFSRPSVSVAMKNLREGGLVAVLPDEGIVLTEDGRAIAETMYARHVFIREWLVGLGVDEKTAAMDACNMEHVISGASFDAIVRSVGGGAKPVVNDHSER
ncbi:MAG: metal-dependent transcriptional regulator [Oscillospiraceae bacterium]|jgi:Mn-dependent DtxR family transcriptional regulator|nr:metal-dependent transcriptional regulator [Oscillospiraceae bacterium]